MINGLASAYYARYPGPISPDNVLRFMVLDAGNQKPAKSAPARPVDPGEPVLPASLRGRAMFLVAAKALAWKPWTHLEDGLAETVAYLKGI